MLIIKLFKNEKIKGISRFKTRRNTENEVQRYNITVGNTVHTVINLPIDFSENFELQRLLKRFKGNVLLCESEFETECFNDFLFDCKPYYKRAIISSLKNYTSGLENKRFSLTLRDDYFEMTEEAVELAKVVGSLIIEGNENLALQEFSDYCLYNFGAVVRVVPNGTITRSDMYADFNEITEDAKLFVSLRGKELLLYPDPKYFSCENGVSKLVNLGVPIKKACAATANQKTLVWCKNP